MNLLVRAAGLLPQTWIRKFSRAQWRSRFVRRLFVFVRGALRETDAVIQKGVAKGLRFNAGCSNAGFVLGTTEAGLQEALRALLSPGMTLYDVGANVGFISVIGARLVGPGGRVEAYEPVPENVRWLRHNVALNEFTQIFVHEIALGRSDGCTEFHLGDDSNWGSLVPNADRKTKIEVKVRSLDSVVEHGAPAPDVMKVDIEGGEVEMLSGSVNTLRKARPIIILDLHGTNAAVADVLEPLDYDLHVFGGKGIRVRSADWSAQILGVPRERATELAPVVAMVSSQAFNDHA
jgi:FkbM family methyltransferase